MLICNPKNMNKIISFFFFILSFYNAFSQENKELIKIKCLKNMPTTFEEIQNQDTIYVLYHKSNEKGLEQDLVDTKDYEIDSYYFYNFLHFPLYLYEYNLFDKVNIRKPKAEYRKESFICKNIKKTIDIYFIRKFGYDLYEQCYKKTHIIYIIDLDCKLKNKYKLVQVNNPIFVVE